MKVVTEVEKIEELIVELPVNKEKLEHLFHSLDIWHKSCKLTAVLTEASKPKDCRDISKWASVIRNHFWYCCQSCHGNEEQLKDSWISIIHHICGEHEWESGQCPHEPIEGEDNNPYLTKDSKAAEAIRKIVFDVKWLKSLEKYRFFRHTSKLESFNSMMLKYAPKRVAFE
ncbi:hypothetical protein QZH41_020451 [Actinostola sp. cb2023]|nr:hypothetical protein QZH41_020451 [Actinostola sp. cb2023]